MTRFIAFLRGINVGGHTVAKDKLKAAFTDLGFVRVSTYKQSGNVIFETATADIKLNRAKIECKLGDVLGFDAPTFLRTIPQLKTIIEQDVFSGQNKEGNSFLVTFLQSVPSAFPLKLPTTIPKSTAQIIAIKDAEVYSITHGGGEGALPNPFIEKILGIKATTRNINVINEILGKYAPS